MAKKNGNTLERQQETGRRLYVALATAACFAILCVCYWAGGQYPFGGSVLATGETSEMLLPLAASVKLNGLGYSLSFGLGGSMAALALQMLASPLTLLLFLPGTTLAQGANLVVLAKLTVAAFAAALLFTSPQGPFSPGTKLGSLLGFWYAFGGFALIGAGGAAALLDVLYLLPLGTLALSLLAGKGQVLPFAFVLFAAMVIAPRQCMVLLPVLALFAAVWLLFFADRSTGGVLALRLLAAFLPALLMAAPAWTVQLAAGGQATGFASLFTDMLPFGGFASRAVPMVCGGALLCALSLVVWGRLYRMQKVRFVLVCLGISLLPVPFAPVAAFWGWLSNAPGAALLYLPGWLSLLLLAAVLEALYRRPQRKSNPRVSLLMVYVNVAIFAGLSVFVVLTRYGQAAVVPGGETSSMPVRYILFYALVTAVVLFGLCVLRGGVDLTRKVFAGALAIVLGVGSLYSGIVYLVPVRTFTADDTLAGAEAASALAQEWDVRGRVKGASANVAANLPGTAGFASLGSAFGDTDMNVLSAYKKLGYSGYGGELSGHGGTILSDAFLNVEYVLGNTYNRYNPGVAVYTDADFDQTLQNIDRLYYTEEIPVGGTRNWFLQATPAVNGWGTVVYADVYELAYLPEGDRFDAQDWLYQTVYGGEGSVMRRYEATYTEGVLYEEYDYQLDKYGVWQAEDGTTGMLEYVIEVGEREALYFDCFRFISADLDEVVNDGLGVSVNGTRLASLYPARETNGLVYLGTYENESVTVQIDLWRSELVRSFGVAGILESDVVNVVNRQPVVQADIAGSKITLTTTAEAGADSTTPLLVLPIGSADSAQITVNGERAPAYRVLDGFMAVELTAGENTVVVSFAKSNMLPGALLFLAGLLLLAALWLKHRGIVAVGDTGMAASQTEVTTGKLCRLVIVLCGCAAVVLLLAAPLALWAANGLVVHKGL